MANPRRAYRWFLFFVSVFAFFYIILVRPSLAAILLFFVAGGLWYWRELLKMRELDSPRPK